jgi:hypothetical protein
MPECQDGSLTALFADKKPSNLAIFENSPKRPHALAPAPKIGAGKSLNCGFFCPNGQKIRSSIN